MKNIFIKFRVSNIENLIIKNKAKESGVSVSELIRSVIFEYKLSYRLTPDEIECYKNLSDYANNFRRISNYIKSENGVDFKRECLETSSQIREHLMKLK